MSDYQYVPIKGDAMTSYVFHISLEADGDGWRAFYVPLEHLGASTWGKTKDEAIEHMQEVLSMIIDELVEEGKPIPATTGLTVTEGIAVAITR